jgi:hypothetical protein
LKKYLQAKQKRSLPATPTKCKNEIFVDDGIGFVCDKAYPT